HLVPSQTRIPGTSLGRHAAGGPPLLPRSMLRGEYDEPCIAVHHHFSRDRSAADLAAWWSRPVTPAPTRQSRVPARWQRDAARGRTLAMIAATRSASAPRLG